MKMYQTELLTTKDSEKWIKLLEETEHPDIYFTPEYAKIYEYNYSKETDEAFCGTSLLFYFGNKDEFVLYPFIKRDINELPFVKQNEMSHTYDVISHYGYNGPIIKCSNEENKKNLVKKFLSAFNEFCIENNIVSEFTRFHPLLDNHKFFKELVPIDERFHTIYVDLTLDETTLLKNMSKKTRNLIRKAEKNNVEIMRSKNIKRDLPVFSELYLQTMKRNKANKKYLFPLKFFQNTVELLKDNLSLFIAKHDGKIIAASLFMHDYEFIHYHFSGADKDYLNLAPNNLLIWKVILWAKKQGYKKFHLGGGLKDEDGLYHFKSGFSKNHSVFLTSNKIHNKKIYNKLCNLNGSLDIRRNEQVIKSDFFPKYREITWK